MDPSATLREALLCLIRGENETAADYLAALADWLIRDGFPPEDPRFILASVLDATSGEGAHD